MELKVIQYGTLEALAIRLNRTFYGIERAEGTQQLSTQLCLNRTFYGIESYVAFNAFQRVLTSLNRTFYGIESSERHRPDEP